MRLHELFPVMGHGMLLPLIHKKVTCSGYMLRSLRDKHNIYSLRKRAYRVTTHSNHKLPIALGLLNRAFDVGFPNTVWAGRA